MTMERPQEEIEWYFERFTETIQKHQAIRADLSPMKIQYKVRTQKGRVYWKIFVDTHELATGFDHDYPDGLIRTNIFGFVRRKDGAIFRAATYKAPETRTKTAIRGYVFDDDPSQHFTEWGITYAEGS